MTKKVANRTFHLHGHHQLDQEQIICSSCDLTIFTSQAYIEFSEEACHHLNRIEGETSAPQPKITAATTCQNSNQQKQAAGWVLIVCLCVTAWLFIRLLQYFTGGDPTYQRWPSYRVYLESYSHSPHWLWSCSAAPVTFPCLTYDVAWKLMSQHQTIQPSTQGGQRANWILNMSQHGKRKLGWIELLTGTKQIRSQLNWTDTTALP